MVTLSSTLNRHPSERPTHPVETSNAPKRKPTFRKIRSSTPGASYDRIVWKEVREPEARAPAVADAAKEEEPEQSKDRPRESIGTRKLMAYRVQAFLRIGIRISLFR